MSLLTQEGQDVELLCCNFSIDLYGCSVRSSYETIKTLAGADRTLLSTNVTIVVRSSNFRTARDLGIHATRPLIGNTAKVERAFPI